MYCFVSIVDIPMGFGSSLDVRVVELFFFLSWLPLSIFATFCTTFWGDLQIVLFLKLHFGFIEHVASAFSFNWVYISSPEIQRAVT